MKINELSFYPDELLKNKIVRRNSGAARSALDCGREAAAFGSSPYLEHSVSAQRKACRHGQRLSDRGPLLLPQPIKAAASRPQSKALRAISCRVVGLWARRLADGPGALAAAEKPSVGEVGATRRVAPTRRHNLNAATRKWRVKPNAVHLAGEARLGVR